uniref:Uncharacterized protein n=1 Tax=Mesocestoides corti TaxID=53468 RepID=A0A5K3G1L3_MESCO
MSRRGCILLIRANSTGNQSLSEFTYKDIMQRRIVLGGSQTASADGRKEGSRMSLHDWLACNVIPDSNALNKAYLRSMKRRKRGPQFTGDSGNCSLSLYLWLQVPF